MVKDRLAIFDLDGTLIDTSYANYLSYKFVAKEYEKKWEISDKEFHERYFGKSYKLFLKDITGADSNEIESMHREKEKIYAKILRDYGKPMENLMFIAKLLQGSCYLALVTTASSKNTDTVMDIFLNDICFDYVLTGDDVSRLKPDMEAWDAVMKHFNVKPEKTIIFDDIQEYINVARDNGISALHVCS